MASLTRWTWVWVNSGSWWWTGRPGVLHFMGSQSDTTERLNWTEPIFKARILVWYSLFFSNPTSPSFKYHRSFKLGGFSGSSAGKEYACNAGDLGSIPGLGISPGEGSSYSLQYSGLENSMDFIVDTVAKSRTWLSDCHFQFSVKPNWFSEIIKLSHGWLSLQFFFSSLGYYLLVYLYLPSTPICLSLPSWDTKSSKNTYTIISY